MAKQIGFIAMHGWGYDRHFFDPLRACFPEAPFYALDKGYYGAPYALDPTVLSSDVFWVALGHSMGVSYWLTVDHPCSVLVSIAGFGRFVQKDKKPGQHPLALKKQIKYFQKDPEGSLKMFMEKCGETKKIKNINTMLLEQDLKMLSNMDVSLSKKRTKILFLHGLNDEIVPYATLLAQCPQDTACIRTHLTAPHALGSLEARWCADQIIDFLEKQHHFF